MPQNFFQGYLAAGTGSASFVEETAVLYARVPVTMTALNGGVSALQASVSLYNGSAQPVQVTQRALFDAETGGNLICWWNLATARSIGSAQEDVETPPTLQLSLTSLIGATGPIPFTAGAQIGTAGGNPVYSGVPLQFAGGSIAAAAADPTKVDLAGTAAIIAPTNASSGIINPTLLPRWRAALTRVRTGAGNARLLVVGDSTTLGFGSNGASGSGDMKTNSWPSQLSNRIQGAGLPSRADAYMGDGFQGGQNSATFDPRIVYNGGNTLTYPFLGGQTHGLTGSGNNFAFTPKHPCDTFLVYYWQAYLGSSFNMNIDGGANVSQSVNAPAQITSKAISGTLGMHTLNAAFNSGTAFIQGMEALDSTRPTVSVINAGWYGVQAAAMSGYANGSISSGYVSNYFAGYNADLILISLGINDWNQVGNVQAYQAAMQNLVSQAQAVADVVLVTPIPTNPANGASISLQQQYVSVIQALAKTSGVGLIDIWSRWGNPASNPTFYYGDGIHGSAAGYSDEADAIYEALGSPNNTNTIMGGPYLYGVAASSTLQANDFYLVNVTASGTTQTLPQSPKPPYQVKISNSSTGATTIAAQSGNTVAGSASLNLAAGSEVTLTYNASTTNFVLS